MKKVKVKEEYDKNLLDDGPSKRRRRKESGFTLLDAPPDWAKKENLWGAERHYERKIEGWEQLCIEAYFSGWVDYFDIVIYQGKIKDRIIYFEWKKKKNHDASLNIYLFPSPADAPAPVPLAADIPKPPPPPMS